MKRELCSLYKMIKKCPRLISIIDVTKYPMMPAEYRKIFNMPRNLYVNTGLKKLRNLGIFKIPTKAKYGKVHVLTETGKKIKRERCKELGQEYNYYDPDMNNREYRIYTEVASARRRRKIIKVMKDDYETLTQIYKNTEGLLFRKVSWSLREFVNLGIVTQTELRGRYKLNKQGVKIRDFIKKIDEIQNKQKEEKSKEENSSIYPV